MNLLIEENLKFRNLTATEDAIKYLRSSSSFGKYFAFTDDVRIPTISWHPWAIATKKNDGVARVYRGPYYALSDEFFQNAVETKCPRLFVMQGSLVCVYFAPYLVFDEKIDYEMDYNNRELLIYEKRILEIAWNFGATPQNRSVRER